MTDNGQREKLLGLYDNLLENKKMHLDDMREDAKRAGKGIPTGINLHCKSASGALNNFELKIPKNAVTIIAARTGGGKSAWLVNLAVRMALGGANGFYVTLEEPHYLISAKMLSCYSRIVHQSHSAMATTFDQGVHVIAGREESDVWDDFDKKILNRVRVIDANKGTKKEDIETPAVLYQPQFITDLITHRNMKAGDYLDFVIIDFGQLMESQYADNSNSYQRMKAVMQACKNMARNLGLAVLVGGQMKRETWNMSIWDWEPELIRDGSDMEQAASLILATGLDKKAYDKEYNIVLRFLKNRLGPKRVAGLFRGEFEYCYFPLDSSAPTND